jgi:hypothetical protein
MSILLLAVPRIDTFIFWFSVTIPPLCILCLVAWHLLRRWSGKRVKQRQPIRISPEPAQPLPKNDPPHLERACVALVESLARKYLELAESWMRQGQPENAVVAWQQILQRCPETREAQIARERLSMADKEKQGT